VATAATDIAGGKATAGVDSPAAGPRGRNRAAKSPENVELFDLSKDPYEKKNLAAEMPEKVKELRARYDELAKQAVPPKSAPKATDFKTPKVWGERD
jgi:hypothetical protein